MHNKKIIFCINSLESGGAERVVSILSNYFSKKNNVYIITVTKNEIKYNLNSKIDVLTLSKKKNKIKNKFINKCTLLPKFIIRTLKMKNILKKIDADVIISFLPEASFISLLANKRHTKIIISDRNDPKIEYKSKIYNSFFHKLYPKADGFVFQTDDAKKYFENNLSNINKKKREIIFNPVNEKFIRKQKESKIEKKIVSVGRLTEQKNFNLLIDSFYELNKKLPNYKLIIYGEGNLRKILETKINKLNLEGKIELPGVVPDIEQKISNSSLFVMTSNYEGMPNALIEAMCLGLPVISSNCPCGGPKMLINNDENGYLFEVGNVKELTSKMYKLLSDDNISDRFRLNSKKIIELVHPDIINKKWENFIEEIIGVEKNVK